MVLKLCLREWTNAFFLSWLWLFTVLDDLDLPWAAEGGGGGLHGPPPGGQEQHTQHQYIYIFLQNNKQVLPTDNLNERGPRFRRPNYISNDAVIDKVVHSIIDYLR